MRAMDSRQRIMDSAAVGPMQFTQDQRTYIDDMPHYGRTEPLPVGFNMSHQFRDEDGACCLEEMWPDNDQGWASPQGSFGREFIAVVP
jgi:hypothetical protein